MKALLSLFFTVSALGLIVRAQESIRPVVAPEFGKPVLVRAEFIAKGNDYHSQNIVSEPYTLKVLAVNGHDLKEPVLIEYRLHTEEKNRTKVERMGLISIFEAYETIYQPGMATPWLPEGEQGTDYVLINVLHVRVPQKNG